MMAGRLLRHLLHFCVYAVCSRGTCHGVISYSDCASFSTGSDLTSTSETDEKMAARTELRGAPRSTESRNADTPLHGSYSLSNPREAAQEGRAKGNRSDRPNRVRRARLEARHEIPPSTTLTEVEGPCGSLSRARQPGSASLHQRRNLPSLGCRHPRDRCPGISCRSPFFVTIRKTARSLLRLLEPVTACSSCDLSASRVYVCLAPLCSYNRR
jgi:hypothetical protein